MDNLSKKELIKYVEQLKEEINKLNRNKKFGLVWENTHEELDLKPIVPLLSKDTDLSIGEYKEPLNYLIEGDNYHSLKVLQYTHKNKIDIIYIDPPYNTGNEFVYNDKIVDKEDNFRHSKWLSFMDKRLRLAKNLMKDDGVIFISIDDNEQAQLKLLMDEIFGESNFVANLVWENNRTGRQLGKFFAETKEYILVYKKSNFVLNPQEVTDLDKLKQYKYEDDEGIYRRGDALFNNNSKFNIETRPNLTYVIYYNEKTKNIIVSDEKKDNDLVIDYAMKDKGYTIIVPPVRKTNNKRGCWRWGIPKLKKEFKDLHFERNTKNVPMFYTKHYLDGGKSYMKPKDILQYHGANGGALLGEIIPNHAFSHPKAIELIKFLLDRHSKNDALILDFFAGSGTTGHAVMELNKEDGGNRSFILCTNNEVSEERVRQYFVDKGLLDKNNKTAFNKFKEENPGLVEEFYQSDEYRELGIARSVTYERIKKVIQGYTTPKGVEVEGLGGNLEYFVTEEFSEEDVYGYKRNHLAELALNSHSIKYPTNIYQNILLSTLTNIDEITIDSNKKLTFLINARDNETLSQRIDEIVSKYGNNTIIHSIEDYYGEF